MPIGFADTFWSGDYAGGLGKLFSKLQQGVVENQQVLTLARSRAEAEDIYGDRLKLIPAASDRADGFSKDDGASVRKAYEGVKTEMDKAGDSHKQVADNIRKLVVEPFSRWCDAHEQRIEISHDDLQTRIKNHDKQSETVKKLRTNYFNKYRLKEDFEEENKFAFQTAEKAVDSPAKDAAPQIKLPEPEDPDDEDAFEIGDMFYAPGQLRKILSKALDEIPMKEVKVTLLGTYQNCTPGDVIVHYIQKNMEATTISAAERIGQDLVGHGFLRLVGNMGSTFSNSAKMNYQWRPKSFEMAGRTLQRRTTALSEEKDDPLSPQVEASAIGEIFSKYLSGPRAGETTAMKMQRDATEAEEKYKAGVTRLDLMRCNLEEAMMDHLKFMERCEMDRLRAIKAVILDFAKAISNVLPALQSTMDTMMLFQETIQPAGDLRYMIDSYKTGSFMPKVVTYDPYHNSAGDQTFGVDLELRARGDKKRVPLIVTTILQYLDMHYPDLETDEARRAIWTVEVPLKETHALRNEINNGQAVPQEILEKYQMPVIASTLKLYFLELPDSLVSSRVYDVIKTIYHTHGSEGDDQTRLSVIQNTLGGLLLANIATLDGLVSHFTRLIDVTSADDQYITELSSTFAPCILRPRAESMITQHDKHTLRLFRDLLTHKEAIFGELKRERSINSGRARAVSSTDESSRKLNEQARTRALLANKSRPSSPAPPSRTRRDSSRGGDFPRLPINPTSPTANPNAANAPRYRQSLEVPNPTPSSLGTHQSNVDPSDPSLYMNEASAAFAQTASESLPHDSPTEELAPPYQQIPHQPPPADKPALGRTTRGYQPPPARRVVKQAEDDQYRGAATNGRVAATMADKPFEDYTQF